MLVPMHAGMIVPMHAGMIVPMHAGIVCMIVSMCGDDEMCVAW